MEVKEQRVQGWLGAAALYGVFGCLMPYMAATPLGWVGGLLGALLAVAMPRYHMATWLERVRSVWSIPAMALSVGLCARGITDYSYPGWSSWVPALLLLLVGWRGSRLDNKGQERFGKLIVWLLLIMTVALVILVLPRIDLNFERPRGRRDILEAFVVFLITAGAVSAVIPVSGKLPGVGAALTGSGAGALTVAAEGPVLASMLRYPFLALCDAAAFEMRLGSLGTGMWALGEAALLVLLLARVPGGKWAKAAVCAGVWLLSLRVPWSGGATALILLFGVILGYLPPICCILQKVFTGKNHI